MATSPVEWIPDEEAPACMCCHSNFTITRRRHHCRKCGKVVCSSCSNYTLPLPAITGTAEPVRVCIECFTDTKAKARGFVRQSLVEFISSQLKRGALPPNKVALQKQLQSLTEQKEKEEKRVLGSMPVAGDPAMGDDKPKAGAATAGSAQPAPMSEAEMMEYQRAYSELAKRHTAVADELTELRLRNGLVATVVFPGESSTINFWSHRYLVITPAPNAHIAVTGFVYPHPSMASIQTTRELGFQFVHNMDELTSARATSFSFKAEKGGDVTLHGVSLSWLDPQDAVTTAPVGGSNGPVPMAAQKKGDPKATKPAVAKPEPLRLRFIVIENEQDNKDLVDSDSKVRDAAGAVRRDICDELLATLHAHMKYNVDRVRQQKKVVDVYAKYMRTEVSWANAEHEQLLQRLWAGFSPGKPFPGHKHELWKSIGFQGADPVTDFRGMGYLGLQCLVYMGEQYPDAVRKLMVPERNYPVCCAGINLVFVLADLLQLSSRGVNLLDVPLFKLSCRGVDSRMKYFMQELMSCLLPYLDKLFVEAKAGYMDFPTHFGSLKKKLLAASAKDPDSIETLIDYTRGTEEETAKREREVKDAREKRDREEHEKASADRKAAAAANAALLTRSPPPASTAAVALVVKGTPAPAASGAAAAAKPASSTSTSAAGAKAAPPALSNAEGDEPGQISILKAHDNWNATDSGDDDDADTLALRKMRETTVIDDDVKSDGKTPLSRSGTASPSPASAAASAAAAAAAATGKSTPTSTTRVLSAGAATPAATAGAAAAKSKPVTPLSGANTPNNATAAAAAAAATPGTGAAAIAKPKPVLAAPSVLAPALAVVMRPLLAVARPKSTTTVTTGAGTSASASSGSGSKAAVSKSKRGSVPDGDSLFGGKSDT